MSKLIINIFKLALPFSFLFSLTNICGCKKLVESPPPTNFVAETSAYSVDAAAISVLTGIYISMNGNGLNQIFQGTNSIALLAGLSADELTPYSASGLSNLSYYRNALSENPVVGSECWAPLYNYVFRCNAAIEGLTSSNANKLTPIIKQQLLGEAKFLRAFFYFYLVNLFGDLPLCISTDPEVNTLLTRSPKSVIYQQIIADLEDAKEKLSSNYLDGTLLVNSTERVRPTKWAAIALLARVYLYTENYAKAEEEATLILNNTTLFGLLPSLNDVFLKNSREAIWQLQPTVAGFNTAEAQTLIIPGSGPSASNPFYISKNWINNFEANDQRKVYGNWINTTIYKINNNPIVWDTIIYPFKYKNNSLNSNITSASSTQFMTEYFMVLRLGELYLIRAEARTQVGKINEAQLDLNVIRNRAGLGNIAASDKTALLAAILHERQVELFSEWGHRWLDLKRTGKIDEIMLNITPLKSNGSPWQSYQQLYPLPKFSDLDLAPNLKQNPGY